MKTYLIAITRSDLPVSYPIEILSENIGRAILKAIEQSYTSKPAEFDTALCIISVSEVKKEEGKV